jgi:hypothetical protein
MSLNGNFLVPSDLYNATLTSGDLVEQSAVLEFHRDYLITDAGFSISFEGIDKPSGNLNQAIHFTLRRKRNKAEWARSASTN